jgi:hypothetical protein
LFSTFKPFQSFQQFKPCFRKKPGRDFFPVLAFGTSVAARAPRRTQRGRAVTKEKRVVFTTKDAKGTKVKKFVFRLFVSFVNFVVSEFKVIVPIHPR